MSLNFNIPMPDLPGNAFLKGVDTGSTLFTRMMNPVLEREKQKQAADQFQQQMAVRKQEFAQAHAMDNLRRQLFEQQILGLKRKNDPNAEINDIKRLMSLFQPNGGQPSQEVSQPMPDLFGGQQPNVNLVPQNIMGMNQDFSKLMDSGANQMPEIPEMPVLQNNVHQQSQDMNYDALQKRILGGIIKHRHGYDPFEQTPEEKQKAELDLFKAKEDIKAKNKSGNTNAVTTKAQNTINGVDNAIPIVDELIRLVKKGEIPGQAIGYNFSRNQQANYEGYISESAETLANALGYPNTEGGFHQAEKVIGRRPWETDYNYKKRLEALKIRILKRQENARNILKLGTQSDSIETGMSDEDLQKIADGEIE